MERICRPIYIFKFLQTSEIVIGLLIFIFGTASSAIAQADGNDIRKYMRDNKADFFVALEALDVSFEESLAILGMQTATATSSLNYVFADCVYSVVNLQGTAEKINVSAITLLEHALLRLRNDIGSLPICGDSTIDGQTVMTIYFTVWTVGEDYPTAYHIDARTSIFGGGLSEYYEAYTDAVLGYANAVDMEDQAKKSIADIVSSLAVEYYKGIGDF